MLDYFDNYDKLITNKLTSLNLSLIEPIIYMFAFIFNPLPIVSYLVIILYSKGIFQFLKFLIPVLAGLKLVLLSKKIIGRPRPSDKFDRKYNFRSVENNGSMPSGDSFQAGLWAALLLINFGENKLLYIVPFVMFARIYYYCHFVSDTIIGSISGYFFAFYSNSLILYYWTDIVKVINFINAYFPIIF